MVRKGSAVRVRAVSEPSGWSSSRRSWSGWFASWIRATSRCGCESRFPRSTTTRPWMSSRAATIAAFRGSSRRWKRHRRHRWTLRDLGRRDLVAADSAWRDPLFRATSDGRWQRGTTGFSLADHEATAWAEWYRRWRSWPFRRIARCPATSGRGRSRPQQSPTSRRRSGWPPRARPTAARTARLAVVSVDRRNPLGGRTSRGAERQRRLPGASGPLPVSRKRGDPRRDARAPAPDRSTAPGTSDRHDHLTLVPAGAVSRRDCAASAQPLTMATSRRRVPMAPKQASCSGRCWDRR